MFFMDTDQAYWLSKPARLTVSNWSAGKIGKKRVERKKDEYNEA